VRRRRSHGTLSLSAAGNATVGTFGATGFLGSPAPSEGKLVSLASRMGTFTP